jgi:hypothetical protein
MMAYSQSRRLPTGIIELRADRLISAATSQGHIDPVSSG